jgi:predicted transcriptional regulator
MRQKRMTGRKCYDHLGSNLGAALLDFYVSNGWIELEDGKSTVYKITEKGFAEFARMGLSIEGEVL